ncbi:helix-turn-helix domain-containing protein [Flavimaribacter sediminis]
MFETTEQIANRDPDLAGRTAVDLWGPAAEFGFQIVPDILLLEQRQLGISSEELNALLNLNAHRWRRKDPVFPGTSTIAERMGVSVRTVQRLIRSLEKKSLVVRKKTADGHMYFELDLLNQKLEPFVSDRIKKGKKRMEK